MKYDGQVKQKIEPRSSHAVLIGKYIWFIESYFMQESDQFH